DADPSTNYLVCFRLMSTEFVLPYGYSYFDTARPTNYTLSLHDALPISDTTYGSPDNDFWQESPTPFFWDEMVYGPWIYLAGVFENDTKGGPAYVSKIDGKPGAYLFAQPTVALFQDYDSIYGINANALHA